MEHTFISSLFNIPFSIGRFLLTFIPVTNLACRYLINVLTALWSMEDGIDCNNIIIEFLGEFVFWKSEGNFHHSFIPSVLEKNNAGAFNETNKTGNNTLILTVILTLYFCCCFFFLVNFKRLDTLILVSAASSLDLDQVFYLLMLLDVTLFLSIIILKTISFLQ